LVLLISAFLLYIKAVIFYNNYLLNTLAKEHPEVLVVGHITHDDYGGGRILPGGSAYYVSRAYLEFGANVKLVTSAGKDFLFEEVFDGLEVFNTEAEKTTTFKNYYPAGAPRIQKCTSQAKQLSPPLLPPDFKIDILHLAPVIYEMDLNEWSSINAGLVVMGLQGFLRKVNENSDVIPAEWHPHKMADKIDMVFLSEEDIAGQSHLLPELLNNFNLVALTKGKEGSDIFNKGKKISAGIYNTLEDDPTGAGDIYSAAFTYSMTKGTSIIESARLASAAASIIIESTGGSSMHRLKESFKRKEKIQITEI
jgi:1D-myo-inositol 3-kinase